jgi:sporulation protein YlmC with PRC-barrel domain
MAELRYGLTYIFLDNDLHFLEKHSRLPGRRRNSPLALRVGMHGGAVMRIGPTFTAVVAITLFAAVGVHSDNSGLSEQVARSAQPRQLAQAPEPSPPTAQPGAESPPSTAPAPPAGAPPNPSPGTPAIVLDDQEVSTILGKSVRSSTGEDMGRIIDIIVSRDGQIHAAIIDFGGFLGIGTRKIAVDWHALNFAPAGKPGSIILELTRNQVRLAPEYKRGEPVVVVGAVGAERMPSGEVAAPER